MPLKQLLDVAKRETYLAFCFFGCAFLVAVAMSFQFASLYSQDPPVFPPRDELAGLDPAAVLIMREKAKTFELERRLAIVERLNAIQVRQIDELQRVTFRIGAVGAVGQIVEPTRTPDDLSGESVLEPASKSP